MTNNPKEGSQSSSSLASGWLVAAGNFFFHYRNGLFPVVFLAVALFDHPNMFLESKFAYFAVLLLGGLIALFGQSFRFLVIGLVYIQRGGKEKKIHADALVTEGIYAHCRNPMYLGNLALAVGFSLAFGSLFSIFFLIPFFTFVYVSIIRAEENFLKGRFGEAYENYRDGTPALFPRLHGLRQTIAMYRFDYRYALFKEYGTLFSSLIGLAFVSYVKCLQYWGYEVVRSWNGDFGGVVVILAVTYLIVRFMKKRHRRLQSASMSG